MAEYLSEIKGQKQAQEEMEIHYSQMCEASDTNTRKEHFAIMKKIYDKYASVRKIWDYIENARKYINRFVKKISEIIQKVEKEVSQYFYIMRFYDIYNNWLFDKKVLQKILKQDRNSIWNIILIMDLILILLKFCIPLIPKIFLLLQ